ncbi:MAG: hypothetical protein QW341_04315, partial [Candidatus Bathyarchaeia archaeon]
MLNEKMYKNEKEMYPHVCTWLRSILNKKHKGARIIVKDTSKKVLSKWLFDHNLHPYFSDYKSFEIEVDVTGIAISQTEITLAFIECKLDKITLRDLSQLLGYSKVAVPSLSLILSPEGLSDSMNLLLNIYRRYDILRYNRDKYIIV